MSALASPGSSVNFLGLLTLPIQTLPYCLIFLSLLTRGPGGAGDAVAGALVGFAWFFLIYKAPGEQGLLAELGRAPGWLKKGFGEGDQPSNGGGLKKGGNIAERIDFNLGGPSGGCCGKGGQMWASAGQTLGRR